MNQLSENGLKLCAVPIKTELLFSELLVIGKKQVVIKSESGRNGNFFTKLGKGKPLKFRGWILAFTEKAAHTPRDMRKDMRRFSACDNAFGRKSVLTKQTFGFLLGKSSDVIREFPKLGKKTVWGPFFECDLSVAKKKKDRIFLGALRLFGRFFGKLLPSVAGGGTAGSPKRALRALGNGVG